MPPASNRKRQKVFRYFGFALTNFWTTYVLHENKIRKNINPENFLRNTKQEFACQSLESFSEGYYNLENKILSFQFGAVCANQTRPNYSVGSEQDEAEIQCDRWSTPEWYNCEKCEKISTSSECLRYHKIQAVQAFHLKFKSRHCWITAVLKIFAVEFNCVENHFLAEFFSEIS